MQAQVNSRQYYRWLKSRDNESTASESQICLSRRELDESGLGMYESTRSGEVEVPSDENNLLPKLTLKTLDQPVNTDRQSPPGYPHSGKINGRPGGINDKSWTRLPFLRDDDKSAAPKENHRFDEKRLKLPTDGINHPEHATVNDLYESFARKPREVTEADEEGRKKRRRKHRRHKRAQENPTGTNEDEVPTDESTDQQRKRRHRRRKHRTTKQLKENGGLQPPDDAKGPVVSTDVGGSSAQDKSKSEENSSQSKVVQFTIQTEARQDGMKKRLQNGANTEKDKKKADNLDPIVDQKPKTTSYKVQNFQVATSKGVEGHAIRLESTKRQNGIRSMLLTQSSVEHRKVDQNREQPGSRVSHNQSARQRRLPSKQEINRPKTEADVRADHNQKPEAIKRATTCIAQRIALQPKQHKFVVSNDREVSRYQQMLSVYLDEKWHKARKQRFFKMLEQFQMKNNVDRVVKQRTKAREMHKSMLRQNEQLEYVRTKHVAEKEKRLASQHVKWKFVRNAINDRQRFGLPSKLHDVVIAKQNMEKNLVTERRKRAFSRSELRRRNEARFEFMFEASTGRRYITAVPNV